MPGRPDRRTARGILARACLFALLIAVPVPALSADTSEDVYYKIPGPISGPPAPLLTSQDYPRWNLPGPLKESRIVIWILAQQHLYWGAFILGALFLALVLELRGLLARTQEAARRYDRLAHEIVGLTVPALLVTLILGFIFLDLLVALYPRFTVYLIGIFKPFFHAYGLLFLAFSGMAYLYYYAWRRMAAGFSKWVHAGMGVLVNVLGTTIMMIANSWGSFMMSPAGVDAQGRFLGDYWRVLHNALWNPLNVHRFIAHVVFGTGVIAAYAAYRAMSARTTEERGHYDWMGNISFLTLVFALFTFPFGGYWLHRSIYAYRQQMGITLLGGLLAWLNIILVVLMSALIVAINYYIWHRISAAPGGDRYRNHPKYVFLILAVCTLVYVTPHTLVMNAGELKVIGGAQHPIVGNFGVESAKQPAINIMIAVTVWSLLMLWRSRYREVAAVRPAAEAPLLGLFVAGAVNMIWLGTYGYYIPANLRVGLSVPMVMTVLSIIAFGSLLTFARVAQAERAAFPSWGDLSVQGYVALLFVAVTLSLVMGLQGYARSSVRLFWHAMEVFRDNSPWAFTHTIGFAGNVIAANVLLFWCSFLLMAWLVTRKRRPEDPRPRN